MQQGQLGLMATGLSNPAIAEQLGTAIKRLDIHRANVVHKLVAKGEPKTAVRAVLTYLAGSELGRTVEAY